MQTAHYELYFHKYFTLFHFSEVFRSGSHPDSVRCTSMKTADYELYFHKYFTLFHFSEVFRSGSHPDSVRCTSMKTADYELYFLFFIFRKFSEAVLTQILFDLCKQLLLPTTGFPSASHTHAQTLARYPTFAEICCHIITILIT